MKIIKVRAV